MATRLLHLSLKIENTMAQKQLTYYYCLSALFSNANKEKGYKIFAIGVMPKRIVAVISNNRETWAFKFRGPDIKSPSGQKLENFYKNYLCLKKAGLTGVYEMITIVQTR